MKILCYMFWVYWQTLYTCFWGMYFVMFWRVKVVLHWINLQWMLSTLYDGGIDAIHCNCCSGYVVLCLVSWTVYSTHSPRQANINFMMHKTKLYEQKNIQAICLYILFPYNNVLFYYRWFYIGFHSIFSRSRDIFWFTVQDPV